MERFARVWEAEETIASVVGIPGIGGHSGDFASWAAVLTGRGISVGGYDYPGNGLRRAEPFGTPRTAVREAAECVLEARERWQGLPVIAAGESLGALVLLALAGTDAPPQRQLPDALVLASPPIATPGKLQAGRIALLFWRFLTCSQEPIDFTGGPGLLSTDPAEIEDIARDPLRTRALPASYLIGIRGLQKRALAHARRVDIPTLLLWGERDTVASFPQARKLLAAIPLALRRIEIRVGERHMLTRGGMRRETASLVADWIEESFSPRNRADRETRAVR